jgi:outer membrane biosynthesis protein TonB
MGSASRHNFPRHKMFVHDRRILGFVLGVALLLITAHRLPAPISEIETPTPKPQPAAKVEEQTPAPAPQQSVSAEKGSTTPTPAAKSTSAPKSRGTSKTPQSKAHATPTQIVAKFAGTWTGVTHTFPWGDISKTITVDPTETKMTMLSSNGPDAGKLGTTRAQQQGDTLVGNFGARGVYSLTPLADGTTALVRLQAPFNDNTASYNRARAGR